MNFSLSAQQSEMAETVCRFALAQADAGVRRSAFESDDGVASDFWRELMDLGVGAIPIDEVHDGLGLQMLDLAIVAEALGYAAAPGPFLGHALA